MIGDKTAGTVYWLTGLSGAGKTTVADGLFERLRADKESVVLLDGDTLRLVFGNDLAHDEAARRRSAMRNARLCHMLSDQGIDVVCATISMWDDCRAWNRANIADYVEIYLRVPLKLLRERDPKGIYARAARGELENVVGVDLAAEEPVTPDLVIDNYGETTPAGAIAQILELAAGRQGHLHDA
jgi:adenylylsulfate kinase-like enzyme